MDGNVGTVHYIEDKTSDFEWILHEGPHSPYAVVINGEDFNK